MTGLVRKATLLVACGVMSAATAMAGVPSPANSTVPARINLVGLNAGVADSAAAGAKVTVTVRDLANNPINGSSVVIDFSAAASDTKLADTQPYQGVTTNCGTKTVRAFTDATGVATFVVVGGGTGAVHPAGSVKVFADGVQLGSIGAGTYDMNGTAGVGAADLSVWVGDFLAGSPARDRADYDNSGAVGAADLSLWLNVFLAGKSNSSAASYCP